MNSNTRYWIESKPHDVAKLIILQQKLRFFLEDFKPYPADMLHLTLLYIGIISQTLNTSQDSNSITRIQEKVIKNLNILPPGEYHSYPEKLTTYGSPNNQKIVLELKLTTSLNKAHSELLSNLTDVFLGLNFKPPTINNFKPHITLGKINKNCNLPKIAIENFKINFSHPRLMYRDTPDPITTPH